MGYFPGWQGGRTLSLVNIHQDKVHWLVYIIVLLCHAWKGSTIGTGIGNIQKFNIWSRRININNMTLTKKYLRDVKYMKHDIALEDIIALRGFKGSKNFASSPTNVTFQVGKLSYNNFLQIFWRLSFISMEGTWQPITKLSLLTVIFQPPRCHHWRPQLICHDDLLSQSQPPGEILGLQLVSPDRLVGMVTVKNNKLINRQKKYQ